MYKPNGWVLLSNDEDILLFCTWRGGYADGDYYRRSTFVESIEERPNNTVVFTTKSGSKYECDVNSEGGTTFYTSQVLQNFLRMDEKFKRTTYNEVVNG